ncbi:MAG: thiolase family protein [Candidatus Aceula meridiana]|nr:thiolase family protein [Candidatus Aceula meridiana]
MVSTRFPQEIYIIDAVRTPIGSTFKSLKSFSASEIVSVVLKELAARHLQLKNNIDEIILGNTVSAGSGQNLAREAVIGSGLPVTTPAFLVNSVCGSGLQSIIMASQAMIADGLDIIIAGGSESASHCPKIIKEEGKEPIDSLIQDGLWCAISDKHMGHLAEELAKKNNISREDQDKFSVESHKKALAAQQSGKFTKEIILIKLSDGKIFDKDERPRKNISLERMERLPGAFLENGTVTAGNASAPADGAAAVILASENAVKKYNLKPKAKILGYASVALAPELCFEGAVLAAKECLLKCKLKKEDIDLFEVGESFASQAIFTKQVLNIPDEKMNIYGGDIALGHPLGSTGARMLTTLLSALEDKKKKIGLVVVCFGSGGAVSVAIERL